MSKRMLIDASHPEETRVVVLDGQKVEEFDFEAASKRPLKGNIYLAKVTRVEPSLQAAFVEYGGNRQGFLAFSEIHPDYYQIPVADRMALLAEQEEEARRHAEDEFEAVETGTAPLTEEELAREEAEAEQQGEHSEHHDEEHGSEERPDVLTHNVEEDGDDDQPDDPGDHGHDHHEEAAPLNQHSAPDMDLILPTVSLDAVADALAGDVTLIEQEFAQGIVDPQTAAGADHAPEAEILPPEQDNDAAAQPLRSQKPAQRWMRKRHYKIQEVIKRRQIILVQVVKEERGNKGAALTTYLSLAGRYCVLMPNTPRGGGISRKITNANDRKRLKSAAAALELPEGMGLIIRTAGENRTKVEIKRDYEYLLRMWDQIRELTLESNAPSCVYEEGDLIKRAIRDLYNKDVTEVQVEGDDGYRNAKDFMRMLMPSHAKNVKQYKENIPLFQHYHIEAQLDAMFTPTVTLKSGGYIVINQTEALVAIDVNSGRATREHSIEDTAFKTNLEAADEVARQLRLRDLAGLIVIDFIDMEDSRNDRAVEKRLYNALKNDRARIQIGKISQFGLLEMSRQRLRAGVVAGSTIPCPHCDGQGIVRSVESTALRLLRSLEEEGQKQRAASLLIKATSDVAIFTLNQKRRELDHIETDYGMQVQFEISETLHAGHYEIERLTQKNPEDRRAIAVQAPPAPPPPMEDDRDDDAFEADEDQSEDDGNHSDARSEQNGEQDGQKRRRRRRRGGRNRVERSGQTAGGEELGADAGGVTQDADQDGNNIQSGTDADDDARDALNSDGQADNGAEGEGDPRRRRRRRRRGGRGRNRHNGETGHGEAGDNAGGQDHAADAEMSDPAIAEHANYNAPQQVEPAPTVSETPVVAPNMPSEPSWSFGHEAEAPRPVAPQNVEKAASVEPPASIEPVAEVVKPRAPVPAPHIEAEAAEPAQTGPSRKGWWQRTFKS